MFKSFTDKWVSRVHQIEEFPSWTPWLLQKTYFVKLVMPVLAQWYESGLGGWYDEIFQNEESLRTLKVLQSSGFFENSQRFGRPASGLAPEKFGEKFK